MLDENLISQRKHNIASKDLTAQQGQSTRIAIIITADWVIIFLINNARRSFITPKQSLLG